MHIRILVFIGFCFGFVSGYAQETLPGFVMEGGRQPNSNVIPDIVSPAATSTDFQGLSCSFIDFEGTGDQSPIPTFDGIASPDWLGIIDADAGGSGNFAHEPSPSTIAFWLGGSTGTGSSRDIVFQEGAVSKVSFYYASFVSIDVQAFDANGNVVDSANGPANWNQGPGGDPEGTFNQWDPVVVESTRNDIVKLTVSGAVNQTGIDDLEVCKGISIVGIEFTQAIQDLQSVEELTADILADGEPPVPLVAGKPGYLRLYFEEVQETTELDVTTKLNGISLTRRVVLQPGCTPDEQRNGVSGCVSVDSYFLPPSGSWTAEIEVKDTMGNTLEQHSFDLVSRDAEPLVLGAVKVCDSVAAGVWQCQNNYHQRLANLAGLLRKISPTARVSVLDTNDTVRRNTATLIIDADSNGSISSGESFPWWNAVRSDISALFGIFDLIKDGLGLEDRRYYGISRSVIPGGILGIADGIPSRGAVSLSTATDRGIDVSADTVAHEVGHMLGRKHTNTSAPSAACSFAADGSTNWPYADNLLRSGPASSSIVETGFDVALRKPVPGANNYEIMSYCIPVWISSFTYKGILDNALDKPFAAAVKTRALVEGNYWVVNGTIKASGNPFNPLYQLHTVGSTDTGGGTHAIVVLDGGNNTLFTRRFTPDAPVVRVADGSSEPVIEPVFSELIPVFGTAAKIVLRDEADQDIGELLLGGAAPLVNFIHPVGGETLDGIQTISWNTSDADGGTPRYWVQYSPDNGKLGSWQTLGKDLLGEILTVDFSTLPGTSSQSMIRVLSTDGINSSSATSEAFSVPGKPPVVTVLFPSDGQTFRSGDLVYLQGSAYDPEDGNLDTKGMTWSSDIDGPLGVGEALQVGTLQSGSHKITLTAKDSQGNTDFAQINVVVADAGPELDLDVELLNILPTTCVRVTVNGVAGSVPLENADYSLDGGVTHTNVPVNALPHEFMVPGSGFFHLIARVSDKAGQLAVDDERFFTDAPCDAVVRCTAGNATIQPVVYSSTDIILEQSAGSLDTSGDVVLVPGAQVIYEAASSIELNPGFKVQLGSAFTAKIRRIACNGG